MYKNIYNKSLGKEVNVNSKLGREMIYDNLRNLITQHGGSNSDQDNHNVFQEIIDLVSKKIEFDGYMLSTPEFDNTESVGSPKMTNI